MKKLFGPEAAWKTSPRADFSHVFLGFILSTSCPAPTLFKFALLNQTVCVDLRNSKNAAPVVNVQTGVLFVLPADDGSRRPRALMLTHTHTHTLVSSLLTLSKRLCVRADSALSHTKRPPVAQVHKSGELAQVSRQSAVRQQLANMSATDMNMMSRVSPGMPLRLSRLCTANTHFCP